MTDTAPDGLPIYERGDPEAPYGLTAFGGGYVIVRPPDEPGANLDRTAQLSVEGLRQ